MFGILLGLLPKRFRSHEKIGFRVDRDNKCSVAPEEVGIQKRLKDLDSCVRLNDGMLPGKSGHDLGRNDTAFFTLRPLR